MIKDTRNGVQNEQPEYEFTCPLCSNKFLRASTNVFPFCSIRCQQIDLGRWYNEEYSLPTDGQEDLEDGFGGETE